MCEDTDVRISENKIYTGYIETKARRESYDPRPLCKRKVEGAIPAESIIMCIHPEKALYLA